MVDVGSYVGGGGPEAFRLEEEVTVSSGEVGDKLGLEVAGTRAWATAGGV